MLSKQERIKRHLLDGRPITPYFAANAYQHWRLASVIHRLKKTMEIETTIKQSKDGSYAVYRYIPKAKKK
jgi:hypothetical protein